MFTTFHKKLSTVLVAMMVSAGVSRALAQPATAPADPAAVGVVSHIKVLSDKVPDVSSLEAWKKSYIKEGMSDKDKALAVFNTEVAFQHADNPPKEYLQREDVVLDPIKLFNVYGYTMCSISSANVSGLARYAGLKARNCSINNHTVPEVFFDNAWHLLDADLIEYFPKADGSLASVQEIVDGVNAWIKEHPDYVAADKKDRYAYMKNPGWKTGPDILLRNPYYTFWDNRSWLPDKSFAWGDTMRQFRKITTEYESCYSQGYQVNIQLRPGETLTRNWFNKGLNVNMDDPNLPPGKPAALKGVGPYSAKGWGDLAPGRIGNGTLTYDVPLATGEFRGGALTADNLAAKSEDSAVPAVHVKDAANPGVLEIRMPSSYVYLGGELAFTPALGDGGDIRVLFSDNNGLDWKEVATVTTTGDQKIDLKPLVYRRYCYQVRFVMKGKGTGLDALKFSNDIQHSQRPLPALAVGENKIAFSAGPQEGTVTIEGATYPGASGKQLTCADFHPTTDGIGLDTPLHCNGTGSITFPVKTPGDITRLRVSDHFASNGPVTRFIIEASLDAGKTWMNVADPKELDVKPSGRTFTGSFGTLENVPPGTRSALVRFQATGKNTLHLTNARIDADYQEPTGGYRPVQVTYIWEEGGVEKKDVHLAKNPAEEYMIKCNAKPTMKSIILELAK